jgi:3-dehydroquinate synthase
MPRRQYHRGSQSLLGITVKPVSDRERGEDEALNIVLIGFMGTGKSAVGHVLAARLKARYFDTDAEIEKETGKHVAQIFAQDGEPFFRQKELLVLMRLAREQVPIIVSTGGGTPLRQDNVRLLKKIGPLVWLTAPPEAILGRVRKNLERRPMLATHADDPLPLKLGHVRGSSRVHSVHPRPQQNTLPKRGGPKSAQERTAAIRSEPSLNSARVSGRTVSVDLGARSYQIMVERGILKRVGEEAAARIGGSAEGRLAVVLSNPKVDLYHGQAAYRSLAAAGFRVHPLVLMAGERYKTLQTVRRVYQTLHAAAADRRTLIVALGGGVIGDVAGFAAATYNRGLDFVQAPTTLLAQVDSSVGGKVGVNFDQGKNLVGAFYQPRLVVVDPDTLGSLPLRERRSGLAEMIKYGIIDDKPFFETLADEGQKLLRLTSDKLEYAIARSCEIKAGVVEQDEREDGQRAILNFGHTVGHALEAITHYRVYRHGEAIAIGMVSAALIGEEIGVTDPDETRALITVLKAFGFAVSLDPALAPGGLLRLMAWDKKAVGGTARFVLMERIGHVTPGHQVPSEAVLRALERQQALASD